MKRRKLAALALLTLATLVGACSTNKVDESHFGIAYTDGPIEGRSFDKVIDPGGTHFTVNDTVYELPARQVTYISGSAEGADAGPLTLTASGGERLNVELTVRFYLNSRPDVAEPFFNEICDKYDCWEDEGWVTMLRDTFGNPQQAVINDIGLGYNANELRYDNEVKDAFAREFATTFVDSLGRLVGRADYFCGPGYKRNAANENVEGWCPDLSVEVNSVTFQNAELEGIREARVLANERVDLAAQEELAAAAEARVAAARATPEAIALMEAEAAVACAQSGTCSLVIGLDNVQPAVPVG